MKAKTSTYWPLTLTAWPVLAPKGGYDKAVVCLKKVFEITITNEPKMLLGVVIERDRTHKKMFLHKGPYVKKLINDLGVEDCHPPKSPMEAGALAELRKGLMASKTGTLGRESEYQCIVGELMWLFKTRYDIGFATGLLTRSLLSAGDDHITRALRVVK